MPRPSLPLVLFAAFALAGLAPAQVEPTPAPPPTGAAAPAASDEAPGMAARTLARIALADLKLQSDPERQRTPIERDFRITAELLEIAHELDPGDEDLLRLLIQAWASAGDAERTDQLNVELVRLDPKDTVTQLAIVSARINRLQNADDRLAAYARFLGPDGQRIDPAIRSRLAVDSALLKRERGDDEGFAADLATACTLDSTNQDAARLALAYYSERIKDPAGRFELLVNALKADPFDPEIQAAMAEELAAAGALRAAERFYDSLGRLRNARGEQMTAQESAEALVSSWNMRGADEFIRALTAEIESARGQLRARQERLRQAGDFGQQIRDPQEIRLSIPFERTRVAAAAGLGDPELIGYALEEAVETIRRALVALSDPDNLPEGMTTEEVATTARQLQVERVWLRLWAGREIEQAAEEFEQIRAAAPGPGGADEDTLTRIEACFDLRRGELDRAKSALAELVDDDVLAGVMLAVLAELEGETDRAVELHTEYSRRLAGSIAGAFCRTRVLQLTGRAPAPTDTARRLQALADAVPQSVEAMIADPRRFMDVRVAPVGDHARLLDKVAMRISIENTSRLPLAVGPDKPINSRFLLAPLVDLGVERMSLAGMQEVVSLNRRLRLLPGERFEAIVWADSGVLGGILQRIGATSVRIRWRVVQGFKLNRDGFYDPGPMCIASETPAVSRHVSLRSAADPQALVGWIARGTTREMGESLLAVVERLSGMGSGAQFQLDDAQALIAACVGRFRAAGRAEKLLLLALCPTGRQVEPFAALDVEAANDPDDAVVKFVLATRVASPTAPLLAADAWTSRPAVAGFANVLRERLAEGERTVATVGGRLEPTDSPDSLAPAPAPPPGNPRGR